MPRSRKEVVSRERESAGEVRYLRVFWEALTSANQVWPVWEGVEAWVARSVVYVASQLADDNGQPGISAHMIARGELLFLGTKLTWL